MRDVRLQLVAGCQHLSVLLSTHMSVLDIMSCTVDIMSCTVVGAYAYRHTKCVWICGSSNFVRLYGLDAGQEGSV